MLIGSRSRSIDKKCFWSRVVFLYFHPWFVPGLFTGTCTSLHAINFWMKFSTPKTPRQLSSKCPPGTLTFRISTPQQKKPPLLPAWYSTSDSTKCTMFTWVGRNIMKDIDYSLLINWEILCQVFWLLLYTFVSSTPTCKCTMVAQKMVQPEVPWRKENGSQVGLCLHAHSLSSMLVLSYW